MVLPGMPAATDTPSGLLLANQTAPQHHTVAPSDLATALRA